MNSTGAMLTMLTVAALAATPTTAQVVSKPRLAIAGPSSGLGVSLTHLVSQRLQVLFRVSPSSDADPAKWEVHLIALTENANPINYSVLLLGRCDEAAFPKCVHYIMIGQCGSQVVSQCADRVTSWIIGRVNTAP